MLFYVDGEFLDVFRESCYDGVMTVCASSKEVLHKLKSCTRGLPVQLVGQNHQWALHVPISQSLDFMGDIRFEDLDIVERITGPAVAYVYEFLRESTMSKPGLHLNEVGYCWPDQIPAVIQNLFQSDDPAEDGVYFVPFFVTPPLIGVEQPGAEYLYFEGDEPEGVNL